MTPAGLHIGRADTFEVDLARLDRVVERIVRGLYYHERRVVLLMDAVVEAYSEDGLVGLDPATADHIKKTVVAPVFTAEPRVIGARTFTY